MAEAEGFLARWSRLKRLEDEPAPPPPPSEAVASAPAEEGAPAAVREEGEAEEVDLASLPPVDSLCADSDYTAFLKKGVPEPLRTMALRKAWATDPAIAGFRGLAEYDWDCNAPGYAALLPTDDVVRLCEAVLGPAPAPEAPPVEVAAADAAEGDGDRAEDDDGEAPAEAAAPGSEEAA